MNRPTIIPSVVVLALVLSACASDEIAPPAASIVAAPVPTDIGDAVDLAKSQRTAGDLDGATATLSQLVLIAPDDPRVLGEYGKILLDRGESVDALAFLQRAIELNPGEWSYYSAQGVAFAQRGDFRSAQMAFSRALMLKPNDPVVLNNFALAQLQAGNLDQAEALLLRASLSGDTLPKVAQNLALVRRMRGEALPDAPAAQVASTAVAPRPPEEAFEANTAAPMDAAEAQSPVERLEPEGIEAKEVQEPAAEMAEHPIVTPDFDAPDSNLADSFEAPSEEVAKSAEETIIENEVIETVELEALEPVEKTAQEFTAPIETPAMQAEVAETAALEVVESAPPAPVWDIWIPSSGPIYLQVGAFASEENAARMVETLGTLEPQIASADTGERTIHRVVVGPYADRNETEAALSALSELGIGDVQVLTHVPGEFQKKRNEIANEVPSGAPADDPASTSPSTPDGSPSLSYVNSF